MEKLFVATSNAHKLEEIAKILKLYGIERDLVCPKTFNDNDEPIEDGKTFKDNALIKARYWFNKYKIPTIADDSGITIKFFNDFPGIYSARFMQNSSYYEKNSWILQGMQGVDERDAAFHCVIAYITDNEEKTFEGYGPNGSTIIVKCLTDNINRTISQVRPAFTKSKAKLGNEGSVAYLYDTYAILTFKGLDEEATLEALMEGDADCQEIETLEDGSIELTGAPTDLYKMKDAIEAACPTAEFDVEEIATTPQEYVTLEGEDMALFERLMNLLNDCDDVDKIYHNVENYEGE